MKNEYIKKLDLLRVLGLLGVFFYHLAENIFHSGYFGVCIFFVLAGFLSMRLVLIENNIKSYGVKKAILKIKKLYPPLLMTILCTSIIILFYYKEFIEQYISEAIGSMFFINNYMQIARNESYFEAMFSMKPLTHVWALSIEMQFYVFFYIILYTIYRRVNIKNFKRFMYILLFASIISSFVFIKSGYDITIIYYSFISRLNSFIFGIISALILNDKNLYKHFDTNKYIEVVLYLILIILIFIKIDNNYLINLFLILYSIIAAIICIILGKDTNQVVNEKVYKVFNIIVKRSYIIYLTHFPVFIFLNRYFAHRNVNIYMFYVITIMLAIIISEILYRINNMLFSKKNNVVVVFVLIILLSFNFSVLYSMYNYCAESNVIVSPVLEEKINSSNEMIGVTKNTSEDIKETTDSTKYETSTGVEESNLEEKNKNKKPYHIKVDKCDMDLSDVMDPGIKNLLLNVDKVNQYIGSDAYISKEDFLKYYGLNITIIGDSLSGCAKNDIKMYFPNSNLHAKGNRQITDAVPIIANLKENNKLGTFVIIALGTNASNGIDLVSLEQIYSLIEGKPMILTTVVLPYINKEKERNEAIINFVNTHNNCYIADWYKATKNRSELFMPDDIHPEGDGGDVYAQVMFKSIVDAFNQ